MTETPRRGYLGPQTGVHPPSRVRTGQGCSRGRDTRGGPPPPRRWEGPGGRCGPHEYQHERDVRPVEGDEEEHRGDVEAVGVRVGVEDAQVGQLPPEVPRVDHPPRVPGHSARSRVRPRDTVA